jgi:hypothetical protein
MSVLEAVRLLNDANDRGMPDLAQCYRQWVIRALMDDLCALTLKIRNADHAPRDDD